MKKRNDFDDSDDAVEGAIEHAEAILKAIDELDADVLERGYKFFESVRSSVASVRDTIRRNGRVSDKQNSALDNWEAGVHKWRNHERRDRWK